MSGYGVLGTAWRRDGSLHCCSTRFAHLLLLEEEQTVKCLSHSVVFFFHLFLLKCYFVLFSSTSTLCLVLNLFVSSVLPFVPFFFDSMPFSFFPCFFCYCFFSVPKNGSIPSILPFASCRVVSQYSCGQCYCSPCFS